MNLGHWMEIRWLSCFFFLRQFLPRQAARLTRRHPLAPPQRCRAWLELRPSTTVPTISGQALPCRRRPLSSHLPSRCRLLQLRRTVVMYPPRPSLAASTAVRALNCPPPSPPLGRTISLDPSFFLRPPELEERERES